VGLGASEVTRLVGASSEPVPDVHALKENQSRDRADDAAQTTEAQGLGVQGDVATHDDQKGAAVMA